MNLWTKLAEFAFIETEHLVLRPFSFMDSEDFYKIASNPENLRFIFLCRLIYKKANMYWLIIL